MSEPTTHVYEVRPRKDKRGVDLICDALRFGGLWYPGTNAASNAIGYANNVTLSVAMRVSNEMSRHL